MFEKVNPCHPDKVADRIAGALVDAAYRKEENPRIAVEVLLGHGVCHIIAESSVHISLDEVDTIVKRISGNLHTDYVEVPQDGHLAETRQKESAAATTVSLRGCRSRRSRKPSVRSQKVCFTLTLRMGSTSLTRQG